MNVVNITIGFVGRRKMGRARWIDVDGLKKGEWTAEEDHKLVAYINKHDMCGWRSIPKRAGLRRCGKSCRLRWLNYLRPGIKRGKITPQEEEDIIKLHAVHGNKWATIAKKMKNRTDNDIKNHWNSCLKKRLLRMGIDPMTHEPTTNNLTIKTTNEECGNSYTKTTLPSTESPPSSGSAGLLNKLAASISSRKYSLDTIKYIIADPSMRSRNQDEEEEVERGSNIDQKIEKYHIDQIWDLEELGRVMEIDIMDCEMMSFEDSVMYEISPRLDDLF